MLILMYPKIYDFYSTLTRQVGGQAIFLKNSGRVHLEWLSNSTCFQFGAWVRNFYASFLRDSVIVASIISAFPWFLKGFNIVPYKKIVYKICI